MAESKMPARIWSGPELVAATRTWGMHEYSEKINASVPYIRADLVEQMAAALRRCAAALQILPGSERDIIKFTGEWEHFGSMRVADILDRADAALSSWEAAQ